jgi:hypothetical protein
MQTAKVSRRVFKGVHYSLWCYGPNQWSYTIFGPTFTQEMIVRRKTYRECIRDVKQLITMYHM